MAQPDKRDSVPVVSNTPDVPTLAVVPAKPSPVALPSVAKSGGLTLPALPVLLGWLYAVGLFVALVPVAVATYVLWRLESTTARLSAPYWSALLADLLQLLNLSRPVTLLETPRRAMPMTWGFRRAYILLPAEATQWSPDRQRCVLLHELAHVQRHDYLIQLLARVTCALYWFHPLAWLAANRLRIASEQACDDRVLAAGTKSSLYAEALFTLAGGRAALDGV